MTEPAAPVNLGYCPCLTLLDACTEIRRMSGKFLFQTDPEVEDLGFGLSNAIHVSELTASMDSTQHLYIQANHN